MKIAPLALAALAAFVASVPLLATAKDDALPDRPEDVRPLAVGQRAADATVRDTTGQPVQLADVLRGRKTVVVFYRGGW